MNLNANLSLKVPTLNDLKRLLPLLLRFESAIVGFIIIAVLGYTAYTVQTAINVHGDDVAPQASVRFDQTTLNSLKGRVNVDGSTASGSLGTSDPFGN